ncbi:MAG: cytochrome d ubiquinol oxidase subunit II [Gammaproteobacteria bacterium]|nr:cytochrome d ubiquinol oxidase subunit II [Gammaproteobacteria bacterium]
MTGIDLPFVFLVLMALAILAYVVLDGFDLGVGIVLPLAPRHDHDIMVASIGPFWDANETWLVMGVGILLVAFPQAHGVILQALYIPVALMLTALIVRGVAYEFRTKAAGWHKELWNGLFSAGSLGMAIAQGYMLSLMITGFEGGAWRVAFGLLVGLGLAGGYALLGATWLALKMEGERQARALRWSRAAVILTALGVAAISLATPFASPRILEKWFAWPQMIVLSPLPLLTVAALAGIWRWTGLLQRGLTRREWMPFVLSVWIFVFAFAGLGYSLYPYLVVDTLTYREAAADDASLAFVLVGALIVLPFILGYTVFSYRVFWGKAKELSYGGDIPE